MALSIQQQQTTTPRTSVKYTTNVFKHSRISLANQPQSQAMAREESVLHHHSLGPQLRTCNPPSHRPPNKSNNLDKLDASLTFVVQPRNLLSFLPKQSCPTWAKDIPRTIDVKFLLAAKCGLSAQISRFLVLKIPGRQ
jgi:hypothetical protein